MNLWLSTLLFASLLLRSSALTPEECQPLVSPISLADPSVLYGEKVFLAGYADHDFYKSLLKLTDSSWTNLTASPAGNNEIVMNQRNRMNGTCIKYSSTAKIEGNTLITSKLNMTSEFQVLPSCDGCMVININITSKNLKRALEVMKMSYMDMPDELNAHALYILGRRQTLTDSELEHFKKQASCLGFSGELAFHYNPEKSFCKEDEGITLPPTL
ncbi:saxitoxin and tetrodotoxin-binding protein 2-like [Cyprinodon tularosa]|uniref:saxitoxin and tetrodotoxin-binding protein 2-like n=1 Tax=Cyprinodon tularosa TaxID=77115 RepID=UPI0018E20288|nr:saxitoxin and tetrodotoxin-binding protein 2-like [Cyprinodon tularosa]XP_038134650.1 saxitoxin and tetrodotoxin-binding protein 2-like [Cyprinodon tularosa]